MKILQKRCKNCHTTIYKKYTCSINNWKTRVRFCSTKCHNLFRLGKPSASPLTTFKKGQVLIIPHESRRRGEMNNLWRGGQLIKTCIICHRPFKVDKYRSNAVACSIDCVRLYRQTEEYRMRLSKIQRAKVPNVLQRTKIFRNLLRKSSKYAIWRSKIFKRDNYTCQLCGKRDGKIIADHKKSFVEIILVNKVNNYDEAIECKELWSLRNGRTLCYPCHYRTHNFGARVHRTLTIN